MFTRIRVRLFLALAALGLIHLSYAPVLRAEVIDITIASLGPACAICNGMLEGKLKHVEGIEKVITNLKDSTFTVIPTAGQPLDIAAMKKAVKDSGYGFRFIEVTLKGIPSEAGDTPTFKEPSSGQVFALVQGENSPISPDKWSEIKTLSDNGQKSVEIKGKAYPGEPMDALEPVQVSAAQ